MVGKDRILKILLTTESYPLALDNLTVQLGGGDTNTVRYLTQMVIDQHGLPFKIENDQVVRG